jgi:hypothetical protein
MNNGRLERANLKTQSPDTSPEIEAILIEGFRRMSATEKLERVRQATQAAQQMALVRLREQYPSAGPRELALRLASLWLDRELMLRAFAWDPDA